MIKLSGIRSAVKHSRVWRNFGVPVRDNRQITLWQAAGRPTPPPHPVKVRNLLTLADIFDANTLVESGTFYGLMIDACLGGFNEIHSIEIYRPLANDAKRRFAPFSHVHIYEGDSGDVLSEILPRLNGRTLFWLDGHYSGEGTGRGIDDSPISRELAAILKHRSKPNEDVILIDDGRCFNGEEGYPAISDFLRQLTLDFGVTPLVADDAIILLPAR